jgi:hypothetical protein
LWYKKLTKQDPYFETNRSKPNNPFRFNRE